MDISLLPKKSLCLHAVCRVVGLSVSFGLLFLLFLLSDFCVVLRVMLNLFVI